MNAGIAEIDNMIGMTVGWRRHIRRTYLALCSSERIYSEAETQARLFEIDNQRYRWVLLEELLDWPQASVPFRQGQGNVILRLPARQQQRFINYRRRGRRNQEAEGEDGGNRFGSRRIVERILDNLRFSHH